MPLVSWECGREAAVLLCDLTLHTLEAFGMKRGEENGEKIWEPLSCSFCSVVRCQVVVEILCGATANSSGCDPKRLTFAFTSHTLHLSDGGVT